MSVGTEIRRQRTARGWSLRDLARKIGASHVAVLYWERDEHEPRPGAVERMEAVFGLEPGSLND